MNQPTSPTTVALVTLGCARNEVDSEELAARLAEDGYTLVDEPADAEAVLVNTCGFVEAAKKDSVDELLAASDLKQDGATRAVVAVGCMAERYGKELATALPEADAIMGFDDYPEIGKRLADVLAGKPHQAHTPTDRRALLPITPVQRPASAAETVIPGHGWVPSARATGRKRLGSGPYAPLKLASGCDRRCTFCAIPRWRGAFLSRPEAEVLAEAAWLAGEGVTELFLVSENTTSYGKDLGNLRLLEDSLLERLCRIDGIERVRLSYLQPAELRPGLLDAIARLDGVASYYDLSFQHCSASVLRRMRRFGDPDRFLGLIEQIRDRDPAAGIRSNVIVGFPGETEQEFAELCDFLQAARLDVVGVFGYSDEDGTEAAELPGKLDQAEIRSRVERLTGLVDELVAQRAEDRIGERVDVLIEHGAVGRAAHQGPEVDGSTTLDVSSSEAESVAGSAPGLTPGSIVPAEVVGSDGADLIAIPLSAS